MRLRRWSLIVFLGASLSLLHSRVAGQRLRPIRNLPSNHEDGRRHRRSDRLSFDLQSSEVFLWGGYDDSAALLGNLTVQMPADHENIIDMDRFFPLVKSLACYQHGMSMKFKDEVTFAHAKAIWDWVNGADDNSFVMVAGPGECGWNDDRQPYLIKELEYDEPNDVAHLVGKPIEWESFAHSHDLVVGHVPLDESSLLKRESPPDISIPFTTRFPFMLELKASSNFNAKFECVDCGTNGRFGMEIRSSSRLGVPSECSITMKPLGVDITAKLEVSIYSELTEKKEWDPLPIAKIPTPASIVIPGVTEIGPVIEVLAGAAFSELKSQSVVAGGVKAAISDRSFVKIDLLEPSKSTVSGWGLSVEPLSFSADRRITAQLEVYIVNALTLKAVVFNQGWDVGLKWKTPYLNGKLEAIYSPKGVCGGPDLVGAQVSFNYGSSLAIEAKQLITRKKLWDTKLGTMDMPLGEWCWRFPRDFKRNSTSIVSSVAATPKPTALPTATVSSSPLQAGSGPQRCTVSGGGVGQCIASADCLAAGGRFESGLCSDKAGFECCIESTPHTSSATPTPASCVISTGESGSCLPISSCAGEGAKSVPGFCAGPDDIQCCYEPREITCKSKGGEGGTCISRSACASRGGSSEMGHCPGSEDIQCCYQPSTSTFSTMTASSRPTAQPLKCGATVYDSSEVNSAVREGCKHLRERTTTGSSEYPLLYFNTNDLDLRGEAPWYEFPLTKGSAYSRGVPGPDRVIFDEHCFHAGSVTLTDAKANKFVACSDTEPE